MEKFARNMMKKEKDPISNLDPTLTDYIIPDLLKLFDIQNNSEKNDYLKVELKYKVKMINSIPIKKTIKSQIDSDVHESAENESF